MHADAFPGPLRADDVPWVSVDQMRQVDRLMVEDLGISLARMMENAGRSLAVVARAMLGGGAARRRVLVLAGAGGNGGGGLVAARHLARPDSRTILIVGAGAVGHALYEAYASAFPAARFLVWNRSTEGAQKMAGAFPGVSVAPDLEAAVRAADIVSCATMSVEPLIRGAWLRPGQHVDLVGAYSPDMREADDAALTRARIFVDSRDTVLGHIGELMAPLSAGVIGEADVLADFYDLGGGRFGRTGDDEITLFKNGGGAHLDLMTGRYILSAWQAR